MRPSFFMFGLASTFASLASAHTVLSDIYINGQNKGDGTCIRMATNGSLCTAPIKDLNSKEMACGRDGQTAVAYTCQAPKSAKLTFAFREYADLSQTGAIDPSHLGPAAVYLKAVSKMDGDSAAGSGWFKIWDEGYVSSTNKWATQKLIDQKGLLSIKLPSGLPTGYYLVRTEILTLQNVTNNYVEPQFYINCAQLFIQGGTNPSLSVPSSKKVSIPGHVGAGESSLTFNVYKTPMTSLAAPQTQGVVPSTCLIKNGNWCGFEVDTYTKDEMGCWAAVTDCYNQLDACYDQAPPTGYAGCEKWSNNKCEKIKAGCSAGDFTGPPNKGVKLGDVLLQNLAASDLPASEPEPSGDEAVDAVEDTTGESAADDTAADAAADVAATSSSSSTPPTASVYVSLPASSASAVESSVTATPTAAAAAAAVTTVTTTSTVTKHGCGGPSRIVRRVVYVQA
ncbi:glycosyl hydrolase family 61-domain-containing protein [Bombardia bombarda]|uniref:lytic cellulose monooxygenase (C4-dehydrogenating) n=1 Tax=Bombardia bombarda TaxID=252184 RepID=A0AA39WUC1_9PEZI|nr:glycosyl hydrolase family 61-domain-containing protein [Bombardia bombarda]